MKRRELVAGTAAAAVSTGCLDDPAADDRSDEAPTAAESPPFELRTVDAPGSEAGTTAIPREGRAILVNFARTLCPTSERQLSNVGEANATLEATDGADVITVTDGSSGPQPSPAELADWWVEHGGDWTVAIDESGAANEYYEIAGFPTQIAIDGTGAVHWRSKGETTAREMISGVETALAALDDSGDGRTDG